MCACLSECRGISKFVYLKKDRINLFKCINFIFIQNNFKKPNILHNADGTKSKGDRYIDDRCMLHNNKKTDL